MQLDVVELLKQVLQWTPLYKPGLNRALIQAAKVGSIGCIKVGVSVMAALCFTCFKSFLYLFILVKMCVDYNIYIKNLNIIDEFIF